MKQQGGSLLPTSTQARSGSLRESQSVQLRFDFEQPAGKETGLALDPPSAAENDPVSQLAARFSVLLEEDGSTRFGNAAIAALAREAFGASAGHGRDAYDAVEAGFNLFLRRSGLEVRDFPTAMRWLAAEQARLPLQTRRDQTQIEFQQFSTPPVEALLVVAAAGIRPGMQVLEPSAGTGNIATLAQLAGAQVDTNEIDPRRGRLLALQGFAPTAHDAERLDNLLPPDKCYDAVVMNPPFSATGGRVSGHSTAFGARHVEQALLRLKPGGRLVAIVGQGMALDRRVLRDWWSNIGERFRVRANVGIDGSEYARFGTTFGHQIIVIDRDGATNHDDIITAQRVSVREAYELLVGLAKEDIYGRICKCASSERGTGITTGHGPGGNAGNGSGVGIDRTSPGRRVRAAPSELVFNDGAVDELVPTGLGSRAGTDSGHDASRRAGTSESAERNGSDASLGREPGVGHAGRDGDGVGELDTSAAPQTVDIEEGTVFAAYRVQKAVVRGSHPHPANVVESAAMACVEPPDVTYRHRLPPEVIAEGRISALQIEDAIYAGQATGTLLPDGARKGHWNGDGTGIGKGREIYAFVYDQYEQGRHKHVHVSASHQLCADAERDRCAVGLPLAIVHQAQFKTVEPILARSGVLFTTYSMLSHDFDGDRERFEQLTNWLGEDFDGVIAFDEAHLMKNAAATPHGGKASVDHGTLRGNMGITLQRMFPQARVRYLSATGATEARHMAPYERLGLWGVGAPFPDFAAFLVAMERGGVAAMEMLCRDLKSVGTYLSRTISYGPTRDASGDIVPHSAVEYEPLLHRLSAEEKLQYDRIADLWSDLLIAFEAAEENAGQSRNAHRYALFYSAQQRFFLQLMMTYSLPDVLSAIENDLREGRSVVLSLFNTGEAQTDRKVREARAEGAELSELDATPREMIVQLIEKQFPLYQYQEKTDPVTGNVIRVRVTDAAGNPEINRENHRRQQELLDKVADLDFPQNPLDAILARFGVDNVAEITGRTHRFENGKYVRRKLHGVPQRQLNEFETRLFQQGKKRVAVLSGAGSTGISVHADVGAKNRDRRVFYAFQLSWSADQQMQAFGRVHRSNQASAPVIRLVLLDLAGQKRLVNAVSKRLAALGALTKGERHSLSSDLFRPEDVTDEFGKAALARLYRQIESGKHRAEGLGLRTLDRMGVLNKEKTSVRENYAGNVQQFLNRIMVLHVDVQNRIFELFYDLYLEVVEAAKKQGAFDFGVEEIHARNLRRVGEPEILFVDAGSGARTLLHELEGDVDVFRRTFDFVAAGANLGFYRNLRSGRLYAASESRDAEQSDIYLTPVKGQRRSIERPELNAKYAFVETADAQASWEADYASTPETEVQRFYLLSGAIFPIYDKVMGASGIQCVKIARAILNDGEALVGLNLSPSDVPSVKQRLGIGTPLGDATADDILGLVNGGAVIELDNGWRLTAATIAGDEVIELVLNGTVANRAELVGYGLTEEIVQFKRRWFAVADDAPAILVRLLTRRRPVRDVSATGPST
jgi:protein-L-isoaspartate O-methyltransferase